MIRELEVIQNTGMIGTAAEPKLFPEFVLVRKLVESAFRIALRDKDKQERYKAISFIQSEDFVCICDGIGVDSDILLDKLGDELENKDD